MSKKKKDRRTRRPAEAPLPGPLLDGLLRAQDLFDARRWGEARAVFEELAGRFANRKEVFAGLAESCYRQGDLQAHQRACEKLLDLDPRAETVLMLGGAYLANGRVFLALRTLERFLRRWPDHPEAKEARAMVAEIQPGAEEVLRTQGTPGEEGRRLAELEEEMLSQLESGRFPQARQTAEQLLRRRPGFLPALNNLGETYLREGRFQDAIDTARQVLGMAPENVHALSNLTRYLFLAGRTDEARATADQLRAPTGGGPMSWVKKAEAFAYLGDDAAVLEALEGAEKAGDLGRGPNDAVLYHLAAVAACRLGREDEAKGLWKRALKASPGYFLAQTNLDDLRRPVGERHAPWPFIFRNWLAERSIRGLVERLEPAVQPGREEAATRLARQYLQEHPELAALVPALLDRGDGDGRRLALLLAVAADTPELNQALKDFALGQRGPDALRAQAAEAAANAGLLQAGKQRMWLRGEWDETLILGFEVTGETTGKYSPQVEALAAQGLEAMRAGDPVKAEQVFKRALEAEPDDPSLLNNLAAAYQAQGRREESDAIIRSVHERFPDYFFGRTNLATLLAGEGKHAEARALIQPLRAQRRFHYTEMVALCMAEIEVALAEGDRASARVWLDLWRRTDPDDPRPELMEAKVRKAGWWPRFGRRRR